MTLKSQSSRAKNRKAQMEMQNKEIMEILGLVENMSGLKCPYCAGKKSMYLRPLAAGKLL